MSEIITLSSDDEENKVKPAKGNTTLYKSKHENNHHGVDSYKDVLKENNLEAFKRFLKFCTEVEVRRRGGNPRSMSRIKDKLLSRFHAADPEYTKSKAFREAVCATAKIVEKDPSNLFVYMKQLIDELKIRSLQEKDESRKRKLSNEPADSKSKHLKTEDGEEVEDSKSEPSNEKTINERHVRKLELIFQKVYRKVKKLEEQEVDWDAEEDSAYMRLERYKKRLYLIWEKWQEVRGRSEEVKRLKSKKIAFSGTQYTKLNQVIESYVNKTQRFPDFFDILKLTTEVLCPEGEKTMPQDQLRTIAAAAFQSLGNQLQKRRVFEFWNSCLTYLPTTSNSDAELELGDPAEKDNNLSEALQENLRQHGSKVNEVIDKFVEQQVVEKLEPKEVLPGMEDEDSKSEGEEDKEDDEDPEDVIALSSSSEGSDAEAEENGEQENGDASHCENGNVEELKDEIVLDSESKNGEVHGEKLDSSVDKDKTLSHDWLKVVKSDRKPDPVEVEPIASCSFIGKKDKFHETKKPIKVEKEKNMKVNNNCDVILLSESDSEE